MKRSMRGLLAVVNQSAEKAGVEGNEPEWPKWPWRRMYFAGVWRTHRMAANMK